MEDLIIKIIEFLMDATGKREAFHTYPDIARFLIITIIAGIIAIHPKEKTKKIGMGIMATAGSILLLYTFYQGVKPVTFGLIAGLNIAFASGIATILYKGRILSHSDLKLVTSSAILLPVYPALTVFPLRNGLLLWFTVWTYVTIIAGVYGIYNLTIKNRDYEEEHILIRMFGQHTSPENLRTGQKLIHDRNGFTLEGLEKEEIDEYLSWKSERDGENYSSLNEIDSRYETRTFLEEELGLDVEDDFVREVEKTFDWYKNQENVAIINTPPFEVILFISIQASMLIGAVVLPLSLI